MTGGSLLRTGGYLLAVAVFATWATATYLQAPPSPSRLQEIQARGTLRVATRDHPLYYRGDGTPLCGYECELVQAFARSLGVRAEFQVYDNLESLLRSLRSGAVDLAAAGLPADTFTLQGLPAGPGYRRVQAYLVGHRGSPPLATWEDLNDSLFEVSAASRHPRLLQELSVSGLTWSEARPADPAGLLELVAEGLLDHTIAEEHELAHATRFRPTLRRLRPLGAGAELAWGLRKSDDPSLLLAARGFFAQPLPKTDLAAIEERYFGHLSSMTAGDLITFHQRRFRRLPEFQALFQRFAHQHGLDWRLVAAVGYQESHWDPEAVSPTGVKGLMMLTRATARDLGLTDRTDPSQSISGAVRFLRQLRARLPAELKEPDRTWLALAAYNIGFGHLQDARLLTARAGASPNHWADVKRFLPRLEQARWHRSLKYGYARGRQAVGYVDRIRAFRDLLDNYFPDEPARGRLPSHLDQLLVRELPAL